MKFPLISKAEKKEAARNMSRSEREVFVKSNPHVVLLTKTRVEGMSQEEHDRQEFHMRHSWASCLLDNLRNEPLFEDQPLKWEEIEEGFGKRRQTWTKVVKANWVKDERRERWYTQNGLKRKSTYMYTGPSETISDHFIADIAHAMEQEGFNIRTQEFVEAVFQGLSVGLDHEAHYYADPSNPRYKDMNPLKAEAMQEKAQAAVDNMDMEYMTFYQGPEEDDVDINWLSRFPLVTVGDSPKVQQDHLDRVELYCIDMEDKIFGGGADTRGIMTKRVNQRQEEGLERERQLEAVFGSKKEAVEKSRAKKPTLSAYSEEEVDEFITPSEGWLEVIKLKQPVHPSMLDEEGKMTVSVTVQYKNLGTDEKPNWVKVGHAMTTGGPIA